MSSHWFSSVDHYCERTDPSFWSEPLNAVSNGAFLFAAAAAFVLWRRGGGRDGPALWLIAVATAVGIGSFLFHTLATRWSLLADVLPIAVFIYSYFLLAMRRFLRLGAAPAIFATLVFAGFNWSFERLWAAFAVGITLNGSVGYLPAAGALVVVGLLAGQRHGSRRGANGAGGGQAARGLLMAGGAFLVSLLFRSVDQALCGPMPFGTHFLWHGLNALVLYILIRTAVIAPSRKLTLAT